MSFITVITDQRSPVFVDHHDLEKGQLYRLYGPEGSSLPASTLFVDTYAIATDYDDMVVRHGDNNSTWTLIAVKLSGEPIFENTNITFEAVRADIIVKGPV